MEHQNNRNIWRSINEFFWMWLASLAPILFGSFFIKLYHSDLNYLGIIHKSIGIDIVFAYVATMISPFLFLLSRWVTDPKYRKELKSIKYGGLCIFFSISVALITTGVFSVSKGNIQQAEFTEAVVENGHINDHQDNNEIGQKAIINSFSLRDFWDTMAFTNKVLLVCYIVALFIWYYSIYLKNIEPPNVESEGRDRIKSLMDDVSSVATESK